MDRQHRQDLKHDKFIDEIGMLSTRARENQRLLVYLTGGIVAVALIVYGIYFYRSNNERQAQDLLASAITTQDSPLIVAGQPPQPNAKFKTETERSAASETQFKQVVDKYSGTDAADVANLYLARALATKGDVAGSRAKLQQFIDEHPKSVLVGSARFSLYQMRIENGETQKVIDELNTEITKSDAPLPTDTLLALLAHAYDVSGNSDKSKETYRRIISEFPDSAYALEAQRRVGGAAGGGNTGGGPAM